jgi:PAS domain S-box-containing protein
MNGTLTRFGRQPRWLITLEGFLIVILIGLVDSSIGPEISTSIFYLVPVGLVTWYAGPAYGLVLSFLGAVVWATADVQAGAVYSSTVIQVWNSLVRFGFFATCSLLLNKVHSLYMDQAATIERRNESLVREIEQRRLMQERLRFVGNAIESSDECICITDLDNRFIFVNKAFLRTYGYSEDEVIGKKPSMLRPAGENVVVLDDIVAQTRHDGWSGELVNVRKDGSFFPVYLSTSLIKDDRGEPIGAVGVARDISEVKRAENALSQAEGRFRALFEKPSGLSPARQEHVYESPTPVVMQTLARRIDEVIEKIQEGMRQTLSFSSLASHELRTPLTIIRRQLEDALEMKIPAARRRKIVVGVYDEVLRLGRIVDDLLSLSTMQAGTFTLERGRVNMKKYLDDFYEEAMLLARNRNVSVVLQPGPKVFVDVDASRLRQVLFNLLDNSLKHTPENGRIRIGHEVEGGMVVIRFSDTGTGIPAEQIGHIFDPFYRGTGGGSFGGAGLGLALVKMIMDAHGGDIGVESRPGQGTTFRLTLPA